MLINIDFVTDSNKLCEVIFPLFGINLYKTEIFVNYPIEKVNPNNLKFLHQHH